MHEFKASSEKLVIPIHKLRIMSSYSAELEEIFTNTNQSPFTVYLILKRLVSELYAVIPETAYHEMEGYDHRNPLGCFKKIKKILHRTLKIKLLKKKYDKIKFNRNKDGIYNVKVPEINIDEQHEWFVSIKTDINSEYIIKSVESGINFKCLPTNMVKSKAIPGFKLKFIFNLPETLFRENNEHFFKISSTGSSLLEDVKKIRDISIIERLLISEEPIKEINLIIYHGGNK